MKWLVTADFHWCNALPYSVMDWETGVTDRLRDLERFSRFLPKLAQKYGAQGLLILGDYFDRKLLDAVTLTAAGKAIQHLGTNFTHVYVLPGNHESHDARLIHFTNKWMETIPNVYVPTEPTTIAGERIRLYPYSPLSSLRKTLERERKATKGLAACFHTTFKGAAEYGHTFQDGLRSKEVEQFDLVLSGHVHTRQKLVGVKRGWYVGSPFPIDFRDEGRKCVWLLDGRTLELKPLTLPPKVSPPFRTVKVDLFDDGSIKSLDERLPEQVGYLRLSIHGTKHSVSRFTGQITAKLKDHGFRRIVLDRREVRTESKVRSKELADGRTDLRKSLSVWLSSLELPPDQSKGKLEESGLTYLDQAIADSRKVVSRRAKVELERLKVRDFGPIGKADLLLKDAGLVSVRAENLDSTAADSNGAGKTTLFKAITWCLYGRTIYTSEKGDAIVRLGASEARVELRFRVDGEPVTVVRSKATGASMELSVERKGKRLKGGVTELQEEVTRILGLDFDTFRNTVLFGQNDVKRFADPSTTDAARKAILRDVMGLGVFDAARDLAVKATKTIIGDLGRLDDEKARLEGKQDANRLEELHHLSRSWKASQAEESEQLLQESRELADNAEKIKPTADVKKYEATVRELEGEVKVLDGTGNVLGHELNMATARWNETLRQLDVLMATRAAELRSVEDRLRQLEAGDCPLCGADLRRGEGAKQLAGFKSQKEKLKAKAISLTVLQREKEGKRDEELKALNNAMEKNGEKRTEREEELRVARKRLDAARKGTSEAIRLLEASKRMAEEAEATRNRENPYTVLIQKAKKELRQVATQLERNAERQGKRMRRKAAAEFWVDGFGSSGLQSWMMDAIAEPLNDRANEYLRVLSDGDIHVSIDTVSYTKTGAPRDKFSISAEVERNGETMPSGGQSRKIELAVGLALMGLVSEREGANVDLLMLDEVFDGLDATGKTRVLSLLDDLRKTKSTILVVSHDADVKGSFDTSWVVRKEGGVSTVGVAGEA